MNSPFYGSYSAFQSDNTDGTLVASHTGGEFFSSILWDIRNHSGIGSATADQLVFDALFRISGNPDFLEFRDAMMAADNALNSGAHRYMIQDEFADKGVGIPSALQVSISGPVIMDEGTSETWTSNITSNSTGVPPYTYEWTRIIPGQSTTTVGTGSSYSGTQYSSFSLELEITDSNGKSGLGDYSVLVEDAGGCIFCKQVALPTKFEIESNYPNPFNPSTIIKYAVPEVSDISIKVYNIMGQEVSRIVESSKPAGYYEIVFDAKSLSSGVYITRIQVTGASGEILIKELKMQLIK